MEFLETLEIFADDVFSFVLCEFYNLSGSRNIPTHEQRGSPFHGPLRMTVRHLLRGTEEATRNLFNLLVGEQGRLTSVRFRLFVADLILEMTNERRYDPFEFVLFATVLSKLAVMCEAGPRCGEFSYPARAAVVEVGQQFRRKGQFNLPALLRINKEVCGS